MAERKKIPIGIEDFREIIDRDCYFVDKSLLIRDIIDSGAKVTLFTRPRRFGKTLNMSMLRYFFERSGRDDSYLFKDLAIAGTGEKYLSHMGRYPVIGISLKGMKLPTYEAAFSAFKQIVGDEFWRHREIFGSDNINPSDRKLFNDICDGSAGDSVYFTALERLSECLASYYGINTVLFIDEYDVPLENAYFNGFYDRMTDLVRAVFESLLKTNGSLEFGVLTGCLRISKESIFTGLNNLMVNSVRCEEYGACFGFTGDETAALAEYYGIPEKLGEIKEWYDGYRFGTAEIYNPWSVLNYISKAAATPAALPEPYWSNTSSNSIVYKLVNEADEDVRGKLEELMSGKSITVPVYEDTVYADIGSDSDQIWSFLMYTGYLKIIGEKIIDDMLCAELVIPNTEIRTVYRRTILQRFRERVSADPRRELFEAIINGDTAKLEDILCDWLDETISYHDEKEQYYHGFLSGLLSGFKGYALRSNRESGDGRPDLLLTEKRRRDTAVIIEIKNTERFGDLEKLCDEALAQIESGRYEAELKNECYKKIIKYGITFCGKSCMVKKA